MDPQAGYHNCTRRQARMKTKHIHHEKVTKVTVEGGGYLFANRGNGSRTNVIVNVVKVNDEGVIEGPQASLPFLVIPAI